MRHAAAIAGLILALALAAWWGLRASAAAVVPTAPAPGLWDRGLVLAPPPGRASAPAAWKQSARDLAWCQLPAVDRGDDREPSAEDVERVKAALVVSADQSRVETEQLYARWAGQLRTKGDERSQAAADMLDPGEGAKRHLFDLARNTRDPVVYGWAMSACLQQPGCELSAQRWAQLDPGNLAPWLAEAQQARQRGDAQALREAVYQLGLAQRNDDYGRTLMALEYGLAQADQPGLQMGIEVMQPFSDLLVRRISGYGVGEYCAATGLKTDPSRRANCLAAADNLWRRADDLPQAQWALGLAKKSGAQDQALWAQRQAELGALQERATALSQRMTQALERTGNLCGGLLQTREYFGTFAAIGELAALRQLAPEQN